MHVFAYEARQNIDIPDYWSIGNTWHKICHHYTGIPLTVLINENTLILATNLFIVSLKFCFYVPAISVPGLILCIAKSYCSY